MKKPPDIPSLLISAINREDSIKAAAYDLGISTSWAYRIVTDLGYRATLLSRDELNLIRKTRMNKTSC